MKRKSVIIAPFAMIVIYGVVAISNFIVGQKIPGPCTSFKAEHLNITPQKRDIKPAIVSSYLADSVDDQIFRAPKVDTFRTVRIKGIYRSFKFDDSARLVIVGDTGQFDVYKALLQDTGLDNHMVKDYLAAHKINSEYELLRFVYNMTPNDVTLSIRQEATL